jgi:hypothetical protein
MPGVPGPTVFPLLLGIVFALAGAWLLIHPGTRADQEETGEDEKPSGSFWGGLLAHWHTCVMWGVILVYLFVMPDLGFPVATALLLLIFFVLLGETRWYVVIGLALGATLAIHLGFALGLNVRLPLGVLAPLFK